MYLFGVCGILNGLLNVAFFGAKITLGIKEFSKIWKINKKDFPTNYVEVVITYYGIPISHSCILFLPFWTF